MHTVGSFFYSITLSPMSELSTLLIQRGSQVFDSLADFGFATGEIPFPSDIEIKDFATRDCPGEDGERVFFPERSYLKAYDLEVEFKYASDINSFNTNYRSFCNLLTGRSGAGTEFSIYSPWHRLGKTGVYVTKITSGNYKRIEEDVFASIKVKFHITNPDSHILLSK